MCLQTYTRIERDEKIRESCRLSLETLGMEAGHFGWERASWWVRNSEGDKRAGVLKVRWGCMRGGADVRGCANFLRDLTDDDDV